MTGVAEGTVSITVTTEDQNKTSSVTLNVGRAGYDYLGVNELSERLAESPYQENVLGLDKFGLSAPDKVGVSESARQEKKYSAKAESEYDVVIDVASLTLGDITPVLPSATELTNLVRIQGAINLAKKNSDEGKSSLIKLPKGVIDVDASVVSTSHAFVLDGLKDVAIVGDETTILVKIAGLAYKGYMNISNCENLTIDGVEFAQEVGANVTGTVESYDLNAYKAVVKIDPAYNETVRRAIDAKKSLRSYLEFHKGTKAPIQNGNFFVDGFKSVNFAQDGDHYVATITFSSIINQNRIIMKHISYTTHGTCSQHIDVVLDDENRIQDVSFIGGCNGNLKGICSLVKGQRATDVISRLKGISCNGKPTSCPDQLATALEQAMG